MNERRCETCEFFCRELEPVKVQVPGRSPAQPHREVLMLPCRRFPPLHIDLQHAGVWPLVGPTAVCGEWQAEWGTYADLKRPPEPQGT